MSQEFQAIYENGILRLLSPLNLPENSPVHGVVVGSPRTISAETLAKQQQALDAMQTQLSSLPQSASTDRRSGRDHDAILYGQ